MILKNIKQKKKKKKMMMIKKMIKLREVTVLAVHKKHQHQDVTMLNKIIQIDQMDFFGLKQNV